MLGTWHQQRRQARDDKRDSGISDDLTLSDARNDARARHLPGHSGIQ
jgi:hypothetical protein